MSPPGRYQSNLFNFLSRQSMNLRDRSNQTWRQMKLAAVWGVQILMYPIYVGFQATRLVGKQLRQTARQVLPKLKAVAQTIQPVEKSDFLLSDTPIQRSLQLLDRLTLSLPLDRLAMQLDPQDLSAPGVLVVVGGSAIVGSGSKPEQVGLEIVGFNPAAHHLALPQTAQLSQAASHTLARSIKPIQGLASLLTSRNLVLVTTENQLLDVLSLEQQAMLQRRIVGEVASYWRQQRSLAAQTGQFRPFVDAFLPLPAERTQALPPIRAIWQLMSWMQTSAVAIAANLFQEAYLLPAAPTAEPQLSGEITALRSAQPIWKTKDEWLTEVGNWLRSGIKVTPFAQNPAPQGAIAAAQQPRLTPEDVLGAPNQPRGFMAQIQAKLREAQRGGSKLVRSAAATLAPAQADRELHKAEILQTLTQTEIAQRAQASQSQRSIGLRRSEQIVPSQPVPETVAMALPDDFLEEAALARSVDRSTSDQTTDLIPTPSWVEAKVSLVAYEKHPLEQLLDWLDRGMSWVEIKVSEAWRWLRDRWAE